MYVRMYCCSRVCVKEIRKKLSLYFGISFARRLEIFETTLIERNKNIINDPLVSRSCE